MKETEQIFAAAREGAREHRPIPFWSLNDALAPEETARQVREMAEKGCGGYFMHARSGLLTDYMSAEWFENLDAAVKQGGSLGTDSYVYDENGWPSGFADGKVVAGHPEYCLKWLECVPASSAGEGDCVLALYAKGAAGFCRAADGQRADFAVCVRTSSDYADVLDEDAVRCFIDCVYEKYRARYGGRIRGFFTDEPQYGKRTYPWSRRFPEKFREKYGYDVLDGLYMLFFETEQSAAFRYDFFALAEDMLDGAYYKQIGDWCEKYGYIFTGHGFDENSLFGQVVNSGDIMRHYAHMQMPGIDWLGRAPCPMQVSRQVSSVARQLGKKRVLTETFALCGWSVGLRRLRSIAEWQFAGGVNVVCQHLFAYSLKGERKRDYPPSHFLHQTWWEKYGAFNGYFASLGALLSAAEPSAELLVVSPVRSAFMLYASPQTDAMCAYEAAFTETVEALERAGVAYELGSEGILARFGGTEGGRLAVGERSYSAVLLPNCIGLDGSTFRLLSGFAEQGGKLYYCGAFPSRIDGRESAALSSLREKAVRADDVSVIAPACCAYTLGASDGAVFFQGKSGDARVVFASNAHDRPARFFLRPSEGYGLFRIDLERGRETAERGGEIVLEPYGSALFACVPKSMRAHADEGAESASPENAQGASPLRFDSDAWLVLPERENALVLDRGEYSFRGGTYMPMRDVRLLFDSLMKGRKNGALELRYRAEVRGAAGKVFFAAESPENKALFVNGRKAAWKDAGFYVDPCIRKTEITPYLREGENEIVLETAFEQTDYTYHVYNDDVLETEKNKIRYGTELENCYLLGDFGVYGKGTRREGGLIFADGFYLGERKERARADELIESGWLFYAGAATLKNTFTARKQGENRLKLRFLSDYAEIYVNGRLVKEGCGPEADEEISAYVHEGVNEIAVRLYSSLRNIFGPFHHSAGDPAFVGMTAFADGGGWSDEGSGLWRERYAFVPFGLDDGSGNKTHQ